MFWWILLLIFVIFIIIILLLMPIVCQLSFQLNDKIDLEINWSLGFIPFYSKQYQILLSDLLEDHIQPFLTNKKSNRLHLIKRIKIKQFKWHSSIGFDDADQTAIGSTLLLTLKSMIIKSVITFFNEPNDLQYNVRPEYNDYGLKTDCRCIFSLKLGQAIIMKFKR